MRRSVGAPVCGAALRVLSFLAKAIALPRLEAPAWLRLPRRHAWPVWRAAHRRDRERPSRFRRVLWFAALSVLLVITVVSWRLLSSPFQSEYLRNQIETVLAARLPEGGVLRVGGASLAIRLDQGLVVEARNVVASLGHGTEVAAGTVAVSGAGTALLSGRLEPRSL